MPKLQRARLLVTGDLHVGRGRTSWGEAVANERSTRLFDAIYRVAKEQRCHAVLVAGDVFDSKAVTNGERELVLAALLKYAGKAGVPTFISTGNHDLTSSRGSNLEWLAVLAASRELPNLHVTFADRVSTWASPFEGLGIVGAPVGVSEHQEAVEDTVRKLDKRTTWLFMGHGTIGGSVRNDSNWRPSEAEDAKRLKLTTAARLAPNIIAWLYGDIHRRQPLPSLPPGVKGWYPGSPIPMDFGETADRGVLIVALDQDPASGWAYAGRRYVRLDTPDSGFAPLVTVTKDEDLAHVPEHALIRLGGGLVLSSKRREQVVQQFRVVADHSTPEAVQGEMAKVDSAANGQLEVFDPLLSELAAVERHVLTGLAANDTPVFGEGKRVVGLAVERFRARLYLS